MEKINKQTTKQKMSDDGISLKVIFSDHIVK